MVIFFNASALKLGCLQIHVSLSLSLFFSQCLKQYVELLIKEGLETAISCPDATCPKQGHLQDKEARDAGQVGLGAADSMSCGASQGVLASVSADLAFALALSLLHSLYFFPFRLSAWLRLKLCRDIKSCNLKEVGTLCGYDSCERIQMTWWGLSQ